ncbi:MAG: hypothetical protein LBE13_16085 [Bacteroidales bacterium]|jgi:hypothetical protein|nr:hypothetical protein [Bacteroidales bacterium]
MSIVTKEELAKRVPEINKTKSYFKTAIDSFNKLEKIFSDDENIRKQNIVKDLSPLASYIYDLINIFTVCYSMHLYPIDHLRTFYHVLCVLPDKKLIDLIHKTFWDGDEMFIWFDKYLRSALNDNIPEDRRHKYEIIYNNSLKENLGKLLKKLEK